MGPLSKRTIGALAFTALAVACGLSVNGTGDVLTVGGGDGKGDGAPGQVGTLEGGVQAASPVIPTSRSTTSAVPGCSPAAQFVKFRA